MDDAGKRSNRRLIANCTPCCCRKEGAEAHRLHKCIGQQGLGVSRRMADGVQTACAALSRGTRADHGAREAVQLALPSMVPRIWPPDTCPV